MKHHDPITPSDAGHGPARGYRAMQQVLRKYLREKDADGLLRSQKSSGGRRKANREEFRRKAQHAAFLIKVKNDEDVLPEDFDLE